MAGPRHCPAKTARYRDRDQQRLDRAAGVRGGPAVPAHRRRRRGSRPRPSRPGGPRRPAQDRAPWQPHRVHRCLPGCGRSDGCRCVGWCRESVRPSIAGNARSRRGAWRARVPDRPRRQRHHRVRPDGHHGRIEWRPATADSSATAIGRRCWRGRDSVPLCGPAAPRGSARQSAGCDPAGAGDTDPARRPFPVPSAR